MKPNPCCGNTMVAANEDIHNLKDRSVRIKRDKTGKKNTVNNVLIKISRLFSDTLMTPMQSALQMLVGSYECTRAALAHPTTHNTWPDNCPTCNTDGPALTICPVCQRRRPELGPTSCRDCQTNRPKVVMCFKYHSKQPLLCVCPCDECKHSASKISKSTDVVTKPNVIMTNHRINKEEIKAEEIKEVKELFIDKLDPEQEIVTPRKYFNFSSHRHTRCHNRRGANKQRNCHCKKQREGNYNTDEEHMSDY